MSYFSIGKVNFKLPSEEKIHFAFSRESIFFHNKNFFLNYAKETFVFYQIWCVTLSSKENIS